MEQVQTLGLQLLLPFITNVEDGILLKSRSGFLSLSENKVRMFFYMVIAIAISFIASYTQSRYAHSYALLAIEKSILISLLDYMFLQDQAL